MYYILANSPDSRQGCSCTGWGCSQGGFKYPGLQFLKVYMYDVLFIIHFKQDLFLGPKIIHIYIYPRFPTHAMGSAMLLAL